MFKSLLGITLANFFITFIIALNNTGSGWEVPVMDMQLIFICSLLLFAAMAFAVICFLSSQMQFKKTSRLFKIFYMIDVVICLSSIAFLFIVDAFGGQFWNQSFPMLCFLIAAVSLNIILFALSTLFLYTKKS